MVQVTVGFVSLLPAPLHPSGSTLSVEVELFAPIVMVCVARIMHSQPHGRVAPSNLLHNSTAAVHFEVTSHGLFFLLPTEYLGAVSPQFRADRAIIHHRQQPPFPAAQPGATPRVSRNLPRISEGL